VKILGNVEEEEEEDEEEEGEQCYSKVKKDKS